MTGRAALAYLACWTGAGALLALLLTPVLAACARVRDAQAAHLRNLRTRACTPTDVLRDTRALDAFRDSL